jgi:hypothetical protein
VKVPEDLPGEETGYAGQEYADEYNDEAYDSRRRPYHPQRFDLRDLAEPKAAHQRDQTEQDHEEILILDHKPSLSVAVLEIITEI